VSLSTEYVLVGLAILLLSSILASKVTDRFGIPALLLFLLVGMLAGSEGVGGIYFDDPAIAQFVGVLALALILFYGGLDTHWPAVRPVLKDALTLSTLGVLITALIVGLFVHLLLHVSFAEGLLVGAISSSTDAAAVFSILRSRNLSLKGRLKPLLELESGSNDPMAALLTIGVLQWLTQPTTSLWSMVLLFVMQMSLGATMGYALGRAIAWLANHLKLGYEGLYPVFTLAMALLTYGLTAWLGGNGFLAAYLAGLVAGNQDFVHRRSLVRFHDGLAWLMQIAMFLTLGLLVFPSHLLPVAGTALLVALCLMCIARPASVFLCLLPTRTLNLREKVFVSWVGLRGAAPIVLATFPYLAGIPQANFVFNVVFFVVLTSVLLQGVSVPHAARWLRVDAPLARQRAFPLEYDRVDGLSSEIKEMAITQNSPAAGRAIVELKLPDDFLVVLIARDNEFLVPSGGTTLLPGDRLLVLSEQESLRKVEAQWVEPSLGRA